MKNLNSTLLFITSFTKLHSCYIEEIRQKYNLTKTETNIISFLYNNPDLNTAKDISKIRKISKGNISTAVESLINKNLLNQQTDNNDRRVIHLSLTYNTSEIVKDIEQMKKIFTNQVFKDFNDEEIIKYLNFNNRILNNVIEGVRNYE